MSLETATTIGGLIPANPPDGDPFGQGAAHIRLIKTVVYGDAVSKSAASNTLAGALTVNGQSNLAATYITGPLGITGTVGVTGTLTTSGAEVSNGGLTVNGAATFNNGVYSVGYQTRNGVGGTGAYGGNDFNIFWLSGVAYLFIDNSNVGAFTLTSDSRIKANVTGLQDGALAAVQKLYPVSYTVADTGPFKASSTPRVGFVADAVKGVLPAAVHVPPPHTGSDPQYLSLDPLALIAVLTKAVQELAAKVTALEAAHK